MCAYVPPCLLQLPRLNVISAAWADRKHKELPLWLPDTAAWEHPISNYSLIYTLVGRCVLYERGGGWGQIQA